MDGLVKRCQVEARRCRAAVAKGSPVDFWRWRRYESDYEPGEEPTRG